MHRILHDASLNCWYETKTHILTCSGWAHQLSVQLLQSFPFQVQMFSDRIPTYSVTEKTANISLTYGWRLQDILIITKINTQPRCFLKTKARILLQCIVSICQLIYFSAVQHLYWNPGIKTYCWFQCQYPGQGVAEAAHVSLSQHIERPTSGALRVGFLWV